MKKQNKVNNKDEEGYYSMSAFTAVILSILFYYFFLSGMNIHPTLHASIGIGIFFILCALLGSILSRFW